jgi:periplasmic protein TonB
MTAQALIQAPSPGDEIKRWALAGAIVSAAHFGLVGGYLLMPELLPEGAPLSPAVIVQLAPVPVAPSSLNDLAPGPEMVEAQPTPKPPQVEPETAEPMPRLEAPADVTLPEPKPKVAEKKPEESPDTQKTETPPVEQTVAAPLTTAAPRSDENTAATPQAPSPGSAQSRDVIASWRSLVSSKIKSAQRYPVGARARHEQGTVTIRFTLSRDGHVLSRSIVAGSGHPELDQEGLAMIARAAPYPAFPPSMTGASITFPVPINFGLH